MKKPRGGGAFGYFLFDQWFSSFSVVIWGRKTIMIKKIAVKKAPQFMVRLLYKVFPVPPGR
jgi:hypothetical protein